MDLGLEGKVCVVTGAATGGVGFGCAESAAGAGPAAPVAGVSSAVALPSIATTGLPELVSL